MNKNRQNVILLRLEFFITNINIYSKYCVVLLNDLSGWF